MSGHSLGQDGDHYWDNPQSSYTQHAKAMPDSWRGPMHATIVNPGTNRAREAIKLGKITDGTSNTLLVGEYHTLTMQSRRTLWAYGYTSYNQSSGFFESRTLIPITTAAWRLGAGASTPASEAGGASTWVGFNSSPATAR